MGLLSWIAYCQLQCTECSLWFSTKSNCDRHLLRKHGVATPDAAQETPDQQQSYTLRNTPERPFKCNQCSGSSFSSEENLSKHKLERHKSHSQRWTIWTWSRIRSQRIQPKSKNIKVNKKKCVNIMMDKIIQLAEFNIRGIKMCENVAGKKTDKIEEILGLKLSDRFFSSPNWLQF